MTHIKVDDLPVVHQYAVSSTPSTGPFTFNFAYFADTDIVVYVGETLLSSSEYVISGGTTFEGGTLAGIITLNVAVASTVVTIRRNVTIERIADFPNTGPFNIQSLNTTLDKSIAILQELSDRFDRTLTLSDTALETVDNTLPNPIANSTIVFNATADGFEIGPTITEVIAAEGYSILTAADAVSTAADVLAAAASATSADNSATIAAAAAQGWGAVPAPLTSGTHDIETLDARSYYIIDATAGTVTINLPAIGTSDGILFGFEVANADNAITIVRDGTDTINNVAGNYSGLVNVGDIIHFIGDDNSPDNWLATLIGRMTAGNGLSSTGNALSVDLEVVSAVTRTVEADTSTALTLALTNAGNVVTMNNAAANVVTIPANATVAVPVNSQVDGMMLGVGVTSITAAAGVTLNGVVAGTAAISAQYAGWTLLKVATDEWVLTGNHGGVA